VAELRAEAASWRVALRTAESARDQALDAAEAARAALEEARTKAVAPLQAKLTRALARTRDTTIESALIAAGLQDADLVALHSKIPDAPEVKVDDDFNVTGIPELVAAYKKWKPDYFKKPAESGGGSNGKERNGGGGGPPKKEQTGAGGEPPPGTDPPAVNVRTMDKKQYAEYKARTLADFRRAGVRA
jgi:hypothetical protein